MNPSKLLTPLVLSALPTLAADIHLTPISTAFPSPVGIDYHQPTDSVIMSVYYPAGFPYNFERVNADGSHTQFSTFAGMSDEVKIATARPGSVFAAGTLFSGNGVDGQIVKISPDGSSIINPWVSLPGSGNGLMRGSLYVDRTGVFGGDLIAATTTGEVWRINSSGTPSLLADVGVHLEGLSTVPNDSAKYGPLAGKIIAGAEGVGLLYAFDTTGAFSTYNVGVQIEDIDLIPENENFFGVNYGSGRLLGAPASEFDGIEGDILLTQEFDTDSGLHRLYWNGTSLVAEALTLAPNSAIPSQWEHVTFAPAGIREIPDPVVPEPATVGTGLAVGALAGWTLLRRRRA